MTKFKVGDEVRIIKTVDKRSNYKGLYNRTGVVEYIRTYRDETTYYVRLADRVNPAQVDGLFAYDENDLEAKQLEFMLGTPMSHDLFRAGVIDEKGNLKENKNMFEEINVLDLHFGYKKDEIIKKYEEKERNLIKKDGIVAQVEAFKVQMKDVKGLTIYYNYDYPSEMKDKLEILHVERNKEIDLLRNEHDDIKVVLQDCDTYEQKQAILKAYGVIDEQGKLIK